MSSVILSYEVICIRPNAAIISFLTIIFNGYFVHLVFKCDLFFSSMNQGFIISALCHLSELST